MNTIDVFCAGAVRSAFLVINADFEKKSGYKLNCTFGSTGSLQNKVSAGEKVDIVLLNRSSVEVLANSGFVIQESIVDIGHVGVGIAVHEDILSPDILTSDALRKTLLATKSISYGDPTNGDSSGIHFLKVIKKLGIEDEVRSKTVLAPMGLAVAELVADQTVELGATQATVILGTRGIKLVGLLPDDLQHITTYALGTLVHAKSSKSVFELLEHLQTAQAKTSFRNAGFRPD